MEAVLAYTRMIIDAVILVHGADDEKLSYQGVAKMSQTQQDRYQALVGDGKGRVSISRDESVKDYGNGGGVGVTVTLTCDQAEPAVQQAIHLAYELADQAVRYYSDKIRQDLYNRGILKP